MRWCMRELMQTGVCTSLRHTVYAALTLVVSYKDSVLARHLSLFIPYALTNKKVFIVGDWLLQVRIVLTSKSTSRFSSLIRSKISSSIEGICWAVKRATYAHPVGVIWIPSWWDCAVQTTVHMHPKHRLDTADTMSLGRVSEMQLQISINKCSCRQNTHDTMSTKTLPCYCLLLTD